MLTWAHAYVSACCLERTRSSLCLQCYIKWDFFANFQTPWRLLRQWFSVISFFFLKVKWLQESVESVPIAVLQVPWLTRRQTTFPMLRQPSANLNWLQCHSTRVQTPTSSFYPIACVLRDAEVAVIMTYLNVNLLMWRWKGWKSFKRLIRVPGIKNTTFYLPILLLGNLLQPLSSIINLFQERCGRWDDRGSWKTHLLCLRMQDQSWRKLFFRSLLHYR